MSLNDWDKFQRRVAKILIDKHSYEKKQAFATASGYYKYYMEAYDAEDAVKEDFDRELG